MSADRLVGDPYRLYLLCSASKLFSLGWHICSLVKVRKRLGLRRLSESNQLYIKKPNDIGSANMYLKFSSDGLVLQLWKDVTVFSSSSYRLSCASLISCFFRISYTNLISSVSQTVPLRVVFILDWFCGKGVKFKVCCCDFPVAVTFLRSCISTLSAAFSILLPQRQSIQIAIVPAPYSQPKKLATS